MRQTGRRTAARRTVIAGAAAALGATLLLPVPAAAGDPAPPVTVIRVDRDGGEAPPGTRLVRTLEQARAAARDAARDADVRVELAGGTYRLAEPLRFTAADGGRDGHAVTWAAAPGARPVLSGGTPVTGWQLDDAGDNVWVADVGAGSATRQLYVDGELAERARVEIPRESVEFTPTGLNLTDPALAWLTELPDIGDAEVEGTSSFTNRYSPVASGGDGALVMEQPAWNNNTFGYDTLPNPYNGGDMFLDNSRAFLREAGQWYLDSDAGLLYLRTDGASPEGREVVLPRLESLLHVGGSYARPVRDLTFQGLTFAHTTWLAPSGPEGYANQQTGTFAVGENERPPDALESCQDGCPEFERTRNEWHQIPAAVQVSAARDINFRDNAFTLLGQVGVGVGMDPNAHATGTGYGGRDVTVARNSFTDTAAAAIVVGGVQPNAHHPRDPRMTNRDVTIADNTVRTVAQDYKDNSAILATYVTNALITHNELSDLPYDGIGIGWGWGSNDPGGNGYYLEAGLYDNQPVYDTPTTFRNNEVSHNLIHDIKKVMYDGGSIYSLSASEGTVITRNHTYNNRETTCVLADQGTRFYEVSENVLGSCGRWIHLNAQEGDPDRFNTRDNRITGNWFDTGEIRSPDPELNNNVAEGNVHVTGPWPPAAQAVIDAAGPRD